MASQPVARSEPIAAFIPELELLIAEAMDEWKVPGLAVVVVQNGLRRERARPAMSDFASLAGQAGINPLI